MTSPTGPAVVVALGVRFLVELALLAAVITWGFSTDGGTASRILLGLGSAVVVGLIWWAFIAPKRQIDLPPAVRLVIEFVLFALAAAGLWAAGLTGAAVALIVTEIVVVIVLIALRRPPGSH